MVVIRDYLNVKGMFWKASLTSITVMYFTPCSLWRFSSKTGMMYFGRRMALLRVCEESKQNSSSLVERNGLWPPVARGEGMMPMQWCQH